MLSVLATNTMVVYGMATSVMTAQYRWRIRFRPAAVIVGLISIAGSTALGLLDHFSNFLILIGAFFVPVFAIMLADYYLLKRAEYSDDRLNEKPASRYWYRGGVNPAAAAVWVIGAVMSYVWTYVWPLPIGATIPAFALSFVLYIIGMKSLDRS